MGFICPDCHKDFGNNQEWFNDHLKAHKWDRGDKPMVLTVTRYKENTDLKAIQNALKSNKIRIWLTFDGGIVIHSMKTHKEFTTHPFYNFYGELCYDNPLVQKYGKCNLDEGVK